MVARAGEYGSLFWPLPVGIQVRISGSKIRLAVLFFQTNCELSGLHRPL
jgi:hypothetical protein